MISLVVYIWVNFINFLNWLSLLYRGRWVPNIRIFEYFIVINLTTLFGSIRTEPSIGCSKIIAIGNSKSIIVLINRMIVKNQWFFLHFDDSTRIKTDSSQHRFDIFYTIFLLYDLSLKSPPIFNGFFGDIIQNDLLLDGVDYFFVLFDGFVIFTQISIISCVF